MITRHIDIVACIYDIFILFYVGNVERKDTSESPITIRDDLWNELNHNPSKDFYDKI